MGMGKLAALVAGVSAALLIVATAPVVAAPGGISARLLTAHNRERSRLGIPQLVWSDRLSAQAQDWANSLAFVPLRQCAGNL